MLRPTVLCLFLACAVSLSSSAVFQQNGMPIMWPQTVSQVTDLPMENGMRIINPWHFIHHMSLYRLMIDATDPYMRTLWSNSSDNPLWGQPLQLGWLITSGRLADPTGATTCGLQTGEPMCVSAQSWWACVNYFGAALSFLSAAQQGLFGENVQVQMQVPEGEGDYCTTYADCAARYPDVMSKWDTFFQGLKSVAESPLPENERKDSLLGLYWAAQMASNYASAVCNTRQSHYTSAEQTFTRTWLNSAEYVSAARFQSTFEKASLFIAPLPSRILRDDDSAPNIADLSPEENHTLYIFSWMTTINSFLGGRLVGMWRGTMCSVDTRENGREMLEQLLLNPRFATSSFMSIITGMNAC